MNMGCHGCHGLVLQAVVGAEVERDLILEVLPRLGVPSRGTQIIHAATSCVCGNVAVVPLSVDLLFVLTTVSQRSTALS
jgi:hypothetical protein